MTFAEIARALDAETLVPALSHDSRDIVDVLATDLMSDVLTADRENFVIATSLATEQVVKTANIVGAAGIVLLSGRKPQAAMIALAREHGIALLATRHRAFEACYLLGTVLRGARP